MKVSSLQAVLLATGESAKLHPLTETKPSPMITIINRPVMEIAIEQLAQQGIKQIFVCLYHFPGSIESHFGDGRRWGVRLEYVLLQDAWGSAGVLRWFKSSITETFIYLQADRIVDLDIQAALDQHTADRNLVTVVVAAKSLGTGKKASDGQYSLKDNFYANTTFFNVTGVYIIKPEILDWIPLRRKWDIQNDLIPKLSDAGVKIGSHILEGYWNPLDSFQDIQDAQKAFLYSAWGDEKRLDRQKSLRYPALSSKMVSPGIWIGRNSSVHPGARLIPPVLVGEHSRVGRGVEIGPEVVIGNNVIVADEVTARFSTIFDHTYAGRLVQIDDRLVDTNLVVDIESAQHVYISDQFLFTETPRTVELIVFERVLEIAFASLVLLFSLPLLIVIAFVLFVLEGKIFQFVPCVRSRRELKQRLESSSEQYNDHGKTDVELSRGITPDQVGITISGARQTTAMHLTVINLLHFRTKNDHGEHTSLGKWLEKFEFHRLPELWNVLAGDMRFVGVKPLKIETANHLTEAWQQMHHDYPPGMTGLWYLQSGSNRDLDEDLVTDIYYLTTRNFQEDIKIAWRTPAAWFSKLKNQTYQELDWQK